MTIRDQHYGGSRVRNCEICHVQTRFFTQGANVCDHCTDVLIPLKDQLAAKTAECEKLHKELQKAQISAVTWAEKARNLDEEAAKLRGALEAVRESIKGYGFEKQINDINKSLAQTPDTELKAGCSVGIECEHGYDFCPICDQTKGGG